MRSIFKGSDSIFGSYPLVLLKERKNLIQYLRLSVNMSRKCKVYIDTEYLTLDQLAELKEFAVVRLDLKVGFFKAMMEGMLRYLIFQII